MINFASMKTHFSPVAPLALLILACTLPSVAAADIAYTNMGASLPNSYVTIYGTDVFSPYGLERSAEFTPTGAYTLSSAELALTNLSTPGASVGVDVSVYSSGVNAPGTLLASLGSIGLSIEGTPRDYTTAASPSASVILQPGTEYWLVVGPENAGSDIWWGLGGLTSVPADASFVDPAYFGWTADSPRNLQFQINGDPLVTPEPATLLLVVLGFAGIYLGSRRFGTRPAGN